MAIEPRQLAGAPGRLTWCAGLHLSIMQLQRKFKEAQEWGSVDARMSTSANDTDCLPREREQI